MLRAVWKGARHRAGREEDQDSQRQHDHPDGSELTGQIGLGALLDRLGDLDHGGGALVGGQHPPHEVEAGGDGDEAAHRGKHQPHPLGVVQVERLVAALSDESHDQTVPFSS